MPFVISTDTSGYLHLKRAFLKWPGSKDMGREGHLQNRDCDAEDESNYYWSENLQLYARFYPQIFFILSFYTIILGMPSSTYGPMNAKVYHWVVSLNRRQRGGGNAVPWLASEVSKSLGLQPIGRRRRAFDSGKKREWMWVEWKEGWRKRMMQQSKSNKRNGDSKRTKDDIGNRKIQRKHSWWNHWRWQPSKATCWEDDFYLTWHRNRSNSTPDCL